MSESETKKNKAAPSTASEHAPKKRYERPEVRYERVFETMALSCGKVQITQAQCAHNRNAS